MLERGLLPDFSAEALAELSEMQTPAAMNGAAVRDLRDLLWASIDNYDSRDLAQLGVAEAMPGDNVKILVTGAASKGTWVRLVKMPVEGRLVHGFEGIDVADRVHVELTSVDVEKGYIGFRKVGTSRH